MSKPIQYGLISLLLLLTLTGGGLLLLRKRVLQGQLRDPVFGHLMLLSLALSSYESEHHGALPSMRDPATLKSSLRDYIVRSDYHQEDRFSVLRDPGTDELYWPNPSLSGKSLNSFGSAASQTVAFYMPQPDERGRHKVAMLNGRVCFIEAQDWPRVKETSHLP